MVGCVGSYATSPTIIDSTMLALLDANWLRRTSVRRMSVRSSATEAPALLHGSRNVASPPLCITVSEQRSSGDANLID